MKLYYIVLSLAVTILSSSFAQLRDQPNFELVNKLNRPVHYALGRADRGPEMSALYYLLNNNLLTLNTGQITHATLPNTIVLNPSQITELFIYSKPGASDAKLFTFNPGKTIFVNATQGKNGDIMLAPQTGTLLSLRKKNDRGYSLENNVTAEDIQDDVRPVYISPTIIQTNEPGLFLRLFNGAPAHVILGIEPTASPEEKSKAFRNLNQKWHPDMIRNQQLRNLPGFTDVAKLLSAANSAPNLTSPTAIKLD